MSLTLSRARGNRPGPPEWDDEDFDVLSSGQVVGRIYRRSGVADDRNPWLWSILTVARPGRTMNGLAATLQEAKLAFAEAWNRYLN
jgi:hypothetical protein